MAETFQIEQGDTIRTVGGIYGIVDEILDNGWLNVQLRPFAACWVRVHRSRVIAVEKKKEE